MSQHSDYLGALVLRELAHIEAWAKTLGVSISTMFDEVIHVPDIGRDRSNPSTKGNGRKVLEAVLTLADRLGLSVEIEHMTDEPGLGLYYACFGFVPYGAPGEITNLRRAPQVKLAA